MARQTRGVGLVLQGKPGVGKSGIAACFPRPILGISCNEMGFSDLIDSGEIEENSIDEEVADDWDDLLNILKTVDTDEIKTVVIDSMSGVAQFMQKKIIKFEYKGDTEQFGAFSEGWRIHGPIYAERLENKLTLLRQKGINVILIGHTRTETEKDPLKNDYQRTVLDMEKWPRGVFTKWAQAVVFLTMDFDVKVSKLWKKKATEHKVEEEVDETVSRVMYTSMHPSHDAKNRLGLPPCIQMGETAGEAYENLIEHFPTKIKQHLNF